MNGDALFSPFSLKHVRLKNRIGLAPMTRMSSEADIAYTDTPLL
jgi:2,4-dienoyl-CoA reductase-like NADH-dependent reductase (Old Yellow Enzyme family)